MSDWLRRYLADIDFEDYVDQTRFFKYKEFYFYHDGHVITPTVYNVYLVNEIVRNILVPIRLHVGVPVIITSAIRDLHVITEMRKRGYHPSTYTDHSYMDKIVNPFGVGAVDFICLWPGIKYKSYEFKKKMFEVYKWLVDSFTGVYGQLIYYTQWGSIHVSNNPAVVFDKTFSNRLFSNRIRNLISDNGSHYHKYNNEDFNKII